VRVAGARGNKMDLLEAMKNEEKVLEGKLKQLKAMIASYGGGKTHQTKRKVSAATRRKMKAAAKKRWAEKKAKA
jgi:hypothetical protein